MIVREATVALSRRQRDDEGEAKETKPEAKAEGKDKPEVKAEGKPDAKADPKDARPEAKPDANPSAPSDAKAEAKAPAPEIASGAERATSPQGDETVPYEVKPVELAKPAAPDEIPLTARARTETVLMAPADAGRPPDMPRAVAPPPLALGVVEEPTHMPGPRDIPGGEPGDRAPAPGYVPRGDSRSLRRGGEFALVYRLGTYVISRFGSVGQRGQWRVVEYPTSASASHSYAKECSRFVSEGFSDYRE